MNKIFKMIILGAIASAILLLCCSCGSNRMDENKATKKLTNQIFECLNNNNIEGLECLFSKNISDTHDLNKEIEEIFTIFEGKIVSYDDLELAFSSEQIRDGKQTLLTIESWIDNVETDVGKIYEIKFAAFIVYEDEEDAVGIVGLKIITEDGTEYLVGDW